MLDVGDYIQDRHDNHNIRIAKIVELDKSKDICRIRVLKAIGSYYYGDIVQFGIEYVNCSYEKVSCSSDKLLAMVL